MITPNKNRERWLFVALLIALLVCVVVFGPLVIAAPPWATPPAGAVNAPPK